MHLGQIAWYKTLEIVRIQIEQRDVQAKRSIDKTAGKAELEIPIKRFPFFIIAFQLRSYVLEQGGSGISFVIVVITNTSLDRKSVV